MLSGYDRLNHTVDCLEMRPLFSLLFVIATASSHSFASEVVVASQVEGAVVTVRDIKVELSTWPRDKRESLLSTETAKENLAKELLSRRTLADRMRQGGALDDPDLQARLKLAQERLLYEIYMEREEAKVLGKINIKALALEKYKAESEKYRRTGLKASHILVRPNGGCGVDAEQFAAGLRQRILDGESFEDLARKYSDDLGSKERGGSLGLVYKGKTVPAFEDAVFALKEKGEVSGVVKSTFGFHVIRLDELSKEEKIPFDEVKASIEDSILTNIRQSVRLPIFEQLRDPERVKVSSEGVATAFKE